ncbi:hypothetical protein M0805_007103 [Coniferiporia weirii]|nr:hypothetical protein M0805_007103 [Coniferiporia weirii]
MLCGTTRFILPGSPSTCALDTFITPLPSILLLVFFLLYVPIKLRGRPSRSSVSFSSTGSAYKYAAPGAAAHAAERAALPKWLHYTYIALVVCLLGLRVLELARLIAAHMGIGLLPVGIAANVLVLVVLSFAWRGLSVGRARCMSASLSLVLYWAFSTVLEAAKVARLSSYNELHPAKGTAYPSSDWLLDNGCMLGLLVIFLFVEGAHCVLLWRVTVLPDVAMDRRTSIHSHNHSHSHALSTKDLDISKPTFMFGSNA